MTDAQQIRSEMWLLLQSFCRGRRGLRTNALVLSGFIFKESLPLVLNLLLMVMTRVSCSAVVVAVILIMMMMVC